MFDKQKLDSQLMLDEGLRLNPYRDSRGFLTTGVGRNLDGNPLTPAEISVVGHDGRTLPITHDQAIFLLHNDEMKTINLLSSHASWSLGLDDVRCRVMIDLCFNMGWLSKDGKHGLGTFHTFLSMMQQDKFYAAGNDLQATAWYKQVGNRGPRLVGMVLTGKDYTS